jgi:hypothetical protein
MERAEPGRHRAALIGNRHGTSAAKGARLRTSTLHLAQRRPFMVDPWKKPAEPGRQFFGLAQGLLAAERVEHRS